MLGITDPTQSILSMNKHLSLTLAGLFLAGVACGQQIARGYVYEDANGNGRRDRKELGIAGVAVSDGAKIVTTDSTGYYELPVSDRCVIFAIKPRGYMPPVDDRFHPQNYYIHKPNGSPEVKYGGSAPTGELPRSLDFALLRCDDPENFRFFAFGDPQPYSSKELGYFERAIVEEARNYEGISFGISLGDIVGERMDLYPDYLAVMGRMGIPWYNVVGNHDRNYDVTTDLLANESFEAAFGPSNYAFRYGNTHFLILDDIILANAPKGSPYVGGLRDDQFEFIANYLELVEKGELVVLCYHIPLAYKKDQFLDAHRRWLFKLLEGHNVLGLSAHTHIQMQFFFGEDLGWTGEKPFHEYNVGTSNGDWYSGKLDERGLPDATMRDGTLQGYAIVTVEGDEYVIDYKVAGEPARRQMTLYGPKVVPYKQGGKYPFYVNFYMGRTDDKVEFRIDGGEWKRMTRVEEWDPTFLNRVYEWDRLDHAQQGRRPNSTPTLCTHLWRANLDATLAPGEHKVEVKVKDMFGRMHRDTYTYRTEASQE